MSLTCGESEVSVAIGTRRLKVVIQDKSKGLYIVYLQARRPLVPARAHSPLGVQNLELA